ncbi:MAG: DUF885 domain-containing protein, partial [Egibacteraceae bacterium]
MNDVRVLADELSELQLAADPVEASVLGDHRFDAELPDLTAEGEAHQAAALADLARRADAVATTGLGTEDRITLAMVRFEAGTATEQLRSALAEFTVSPTLVGPHAALLETCPKLT